VIRFLVSDRRLREAGTRHRAEIRIARWVADQPPAMWPAAAAARWEIPAIESVGALARWLRLDPAELEWFADLRRWNSRAGRAEQLDHYHYRLVRKAGGHPRLIEAPKDRLKILQRQILNGILLGIPVHDAVHGFRRGRSIRTFAVPHAGSGVILRMDLRDFFPSISRARVQAVFRVAGYPEPVADRLGAIVTNAAPRGLWSRTGVVHGPEELREARDLYGRPHLPQGAPSSPALANLCAYRFDCRLSGLARAAGARYTRYADDLAFSGGEALERSISSFAARTTAILAEEGFAVHPRKTRVMRRGVRQYLAGISINEHPNLVRKDFDRLKAILHNCARFGPEGQNREAHPAFRMHLEGRVSFAEMVNPEKGRRLRRVLERIRW